MAQKFNIEAAYFNRNLNINLLHAIYESRTLEEWYVRQYTADEYQRRLWRVILRGYKLHYWATNGVVPTQQDVYSWVGDLGEQHRHMYMNLYNVPDPRLHPQNFRVNGKLEAYMTQNVPQYNRNRFKNFVYGCRVREISLRPASHDDFIIQKWTICKEPELSLCISWGAFCFAKFEILTQPYEGPSGPDTHWFIRDDPRPDPTNGDIREVNDFDPKSPGQPRRPEGSRWVFEKTLYAAPERDWSEPSRQTTQRAVHLFTLVSQDNRILKRIVAKIVGGEGGLEALQRDIDHEYETHAALSSTRCKHILEVYGCSIRPRTHPPDLGYIFMEYAEHGDLHDFLEYLEDNPDKQVPEPYVWLIFRGLLEAVFAMTCGKAIRKDQPFDEDGAGLEESIVGDWEPIINPDIKPHNVVLTQPQNDYYPGYLTAKMIDFGIAKSEDECQNYECKRHGIGTEGWGPPEHRTPYDWNTKYNDTPIHVHSEIFNVGQIVFSLMEGQKREVVEQDRYQERMAHAPDYRNCYSDFLESTVAQCLQWDPNLRPTLVSLLHCTKKGLADWEAVYGSVNKPEADIPDFAKYKYNTSEDMLPIGGIAPQKWIEMKMKKRRQRGVINRVEKRPKMTQSPPKKGIKENVMAAVKKHLSGYFKGSTGSSGAMSELHGGIQHLHSVIGMGGQIRHVNVGSKDPQPGMQPLNPNIQSAPDSGVDNEAEEEGQDNLDLYE